MWLHDIQGPDLDRLSGIYRLALNLLGQLSTHSQTRPLLSSEVSGRQSWSQLQASLSLWVSSHTLPLRSGSAVSLPHHILGTFLFFCTPFGGTSLCSPSVSLHCLSPLNLSWLSLVYSTHPPTIRGLCAFRHPRPPTPVSPSIVLSRAPTWAVQSRAPPWFCLSEAACLHPGPGSQESLQALCYFSFFVDHAR